MKDEADIFSKESIEFATVAKEFTHFLEQAKTMSKERFVDTAAKMLPLLYLKGMLLPNIDDYDDSYAGKFVKEADWSFVQQTTAAKLGEDDEYVEVHDYAVFNSYDFITVPASELFADLYQETGDFIGAFHTGMPPVIACALHDCKDNFANYWGIRTIELAKLLHKIKFLNSDK